MNKKNFSISKWLDENKLYLLAFILPVISMLFVYYFKDVYPFGDQMYLRSDCYHQYAPYLDILKEKLSSGGSLLYTWEIGGGMNFVALAAYYLASPFNLLVLFLPGTISDAVSFFIIAKMGLAGFSAAYYLSTRFGNKDLSVVIFSMLYALSAYFAAFSWNIMWLDCMFLLPFIMLGLERLVNEGKCKMYCISLALTIFSNYYIAIMLCIYSVLYFIYLSLVRNFDEEINKVKSHLIAIKDFALYSLLAGGLAACVVLPEYFNLLTTKSADSSFPEKLEEYFSVLYMLFRSLFAIPVADLKYPHDPNIYCSIIVFILVPLFVICKKINIKERIGKTALALIFLLSFSFNIPNYIWHGFHFPNSLPCRESFIYIFLIVTMAYEAFLHIREINGKHLAATFAGSALLILVLEELFKNADFFSDLVITTDITKIIYTSLLFLVIYVVLIALYKYHENKSFIISYLIGSIIFIELILNFTITGIPSTSNRDAYVESNEAFKQLNEAAKKDADADGVKFYRSEQLSHRTRNDGALFKYNSISTFSSVSSAAIQDYFTSIGLQTSFNAYSSYGITPLTAALFSLRYEYSTGDTSFPSESSLLSSASYMADGNNQTTLNIYKYEKSLPLGFVINSSTMSEWDLSGSDPFTIQNSFVTTAISGGSTIFHKIQSDSTASFTAEFATSDGTDNNIPSVTPSSLDVYFYCPTSAETLNANITTPDGVSTSQSFSSTQQNYICHIGTVEKGSAITITAGDGSAISECYGYAFDSDAWAVDYELLNSQPYTIESFKDTKIEGSVTAASSGLLYTSIPYDKGWSVYVDGNKVKPIAICSGSLMGAYVSQGTHSVTFKYTPSGFVYGILISLVSLLILLALIFKKKLIALIKKEAINGNGSKSKKDNAKSNNSKIKNESINTNSNKNKQKEITSENNATDNNPKASEH